MVSQQDPTRSMIDSMKKQVGFVEADDCTPCNIAGALSAFKELAESGQSGIDIGILERGTSDVTTPREWMLRMRNAVQSCDVEKGDCETPRILLAAVEESVDPDEINELSHAMDAELAGLADVGGGA